MWGPAVRVGISGVALPCGTWPEPLSGGSAPVDSAVDNFVDRGNVMSVAGES